MDVMEASVVSSAEMKMVLAGLNALKRGEASYRLPDEWTGVAGKVADAFNDVASSTAAWPTSSSGLSRVVGKEGKLSTARHRSATSAASGATRSTRSTR